MRPTITRLAEHRRAGGGRAREHARGAHPRVTSDQIQEKA
jgi:hypothetical protein